jgi:hypothetical protein
VLQLDVLDLDHLHEVWWWCMDDYNINWSSLASVSNSMAVLEAYVHRKCKLVFSVISVSFMFHTSYILIIEHVRHKNFSWFSQISEFAMFLKIRWITWFSRKWRESMYLWSFLVCLDLKWKLFIGNKSEFVRQEVHGIWMNHR